MFVTGVPGVKPVIGTVEPESVSDRAGLVNGDLVVRVGERAVATWEGTILAMLDALLADGDIPLTVAGENGQKRDVVLLTAGEESNLTEPGQLFIGLGFQPWSPELPPVIDEITPNGPAERAGMRPGDEVIAAAGSAVTSWPQWVEYVRAHPNERVDTLVLRDGEQVALSIDIGESESEGDRIGRIGASVRVSEDLYADMQAERRYGLVEAGPAAISKTWEMMALTVRMAGSMLTGGVSVKNISGPINIAQYAGYSATVGLVQFLSSLAIVSISLGILNLLPIPMLDGGQIFYQLLEAVKGSPISERGQIFGQQIGIFFLLLLMSFAFYNDLARIFG
jgi:regulator of sigma E protease